MIAPLDWGLGHATRCIPLIKDFLANGFMVIIAAEKAAQSLLSREFQEVTFIPLKGYRISYSKKKATLHVKIISQIPGILLSIYTEHTWLKKVVKKYSINAIIADNRFGLYHSTIPSIYITHQLLVKSGNVFSERILQKIHYWFIKKYSYCWVPDFEGKCNIAGELSHPISRPFNINYIGGLSRFEKIAGAVKRYDLLVLVSGPEPQRTLFEALLMEQLRSYPGKAMIVRGLPGTAKTREGLDEPWVENPRLTIINHLSAEDLSKAIQQAEIVICRSGYTTIMDLIKLRQKAILVPTPGQTEQEYLAWHLMKQDFFYSTGQAGFTLTEALHQAAHFPFSLPSFDMEQYKKAVGEFVQSMDRLA